MPRKVAPRIDVYAVLSRAVEEGVRYGLTRHQKYATTPLSAKVRQSIEEHVEREVINALCAVVLLD